MLPQVHAQILVGNLMVSGGGPLGGNQVTRVGPPGYKGGPPQPVSEISAFLRTDPGALKPQDIRDQPPVNQQEPSPGKTPLAP